MHAFFCQNFSGCGEIVSLEKGESDHLFKTLRAKPGEVVGLLNGAGRFGQAAVNGDRTLTVRQVTDFAVPEQKIHLFLAAPRKQKLDLVLKQAVELGVWAIHIMHCDYSVAQPEEVGDRWRILLLEACKQSNNPFLPEIRIHRKFSDALAWLKAQNLYGLYGAVTPTSGDGVEKISTQVAYLVGPEGGFSEKELLMMIDAGMEGLNLGPYILRLETAAIAAIPFIRSRM